MGKRNPATIGWVSAPSRVGGVGRPLSPETEVGTRQKSLGKPARVSKMLTAAKLDEMGMGESFFKALEAQNSHSIASKPPTKR